MIILIILTFNLTTLGFLLYSINNFNLKQIMNILTLKYVTLYWILLHVLDQYNGSVTLKDFELPDDGFD